MVLARRRRARRARRGSHPGAGGGGPPGPVPVDAAHPAHRGEDRRALRRQRDALSGAPVGGAGGGGGGGLRGPAHRGPDRQHPPLPRPLPGQGRRSDGDDRRAARQGQRLLRRSGRLDAPVRRAGGGVGQRADRRQLGAGGGGHRPVLPAAARGPGVHDLPRRRRHGRGRLPRGGQLRRPCTACRLSSSSRTTSIRSTPASISGSRPARWLAWPRPTGCRCAASTATTCWRCTRRPRRRWPGPAAARDPRPSWPTPTAGASTAAPTTTTTSATAPAASWRPGRPAARSSASARACARATCWRLR